MKPQYTKRQHHFPQMMLKRFVNANGNLYMFDSVSNKIEPRTTETAGYQNHLYTVFYDNKKDDALENKFSLIENHAEALVNEAHALFTFPVSTAYIQYYALNNLPRLIEFLCILVTRTPKKVKIAHEHGASEKVIQTLVRNAKIRGYYDETAKAYINKVVSIKGFSFAEVIAELADDFRIKLLRGFDVNLCLSPEGSFIVSDNFATIERGLNFDLKHAESGQWWMADIKIHCPLSSQCCFTFTRRFDVKSSPKFSLVHINRSYVEAVNRLTCETKERYLYCASLNELETLLPHAQVRHC